MENDSKLILDISKAIDAASGFAQGLETQDLEGKVTKAHNLIEDEENEDEKDGHNKPE